MIGVTWAELLSRYRNRLSETSAKFFDDAQALGFANEAQDVICTKVPYTVITSYTTTTIPYRAEYLLPETIIQPTGAFVRRAGGQLIRTNFVEKDILDGVKSFGSATRVPTQYLELSVEGHKRPTPLSATTDFTDIPAYVVGAVVDYMEAMAKTADEENAEHTLAWGRFQSSLEALQMARVSEQWDQHERTRMYRRVNRGFGGPFWSTYRQTEEGVSVELWGV